MAASSFASQQQTEKVVWARLTWKAHREKQILKNIISVGDNTPIHKVVELTPTEKGDKCIFQLVNDLQEDGGVGDGEREGYEEALEAGEQEIVIDLINHGVRNKGKMDDQRGVLNVRDFARERLSHWLADRTDQMIMLMLSGIGFEYNLDGSLRPARSKLKNLAFAADVSAPTSKRLLTWNGTTLLGAGDTGFGTGSVTSSYLPTYKMIVDVGAYMRTHRIKPLTSGGREYFMALVHPLTMALLKLDTAYQNALNGAAARGDNNPWFTGADVTIDGMIVKQHNYVYNTLGAASGSKWGSGGTVNGTRTVFMGAQALAYADLNIGNWVEKKFQYDSFWGINIDKMMGFKVPQFYSIVDQSVQDFGRVCVDHHIK